MGVSGIDLFITGFRLHVADVSWPLKITGKNTNANYNPVAEAESILAEDALQVPQFEGTGSLVSALAY